MIDRKASGPILAFLLVLITFDAFQQKFYIDRFNLLPENVDLSALIWSHFVRWTLWALVASAFGYVFWSGIKSESTAKGSKSIIHTALLIIPFLLLAIGLVSLFSLLFGNHPIDTSQLADAFTFFFYQKGITFFMAFATLALYLYTLLQSREINAQWVELSDLRQSKPDQQLVELSDAAPYITIKIGQQMRLVPVADINWIQADDYCVRIHTSTKSYCLRKSMKFLEKELSPFRFVRVHRGALLNLNFVDKINFDSATVKLHNNSELPLSKSGEQLLRRTMKELSI